MLQSERKAVIRAMRLAAVKGFNPYDSHAAMAKQYDKCLRMQLMRCKSEQAANRWLAANA